MLVATLAFLWKRQLFLTRFEEAVRQEADHMGKELLPVVPRLEDA